jgi:hypothetical protein
MRANEQLGLTIPQFPNCVCLPYFLKECLSHFAELYTVDLQPKLVTCTTFWPIDFNFPTPHFLGNGALSAALYLGRNTRKRTGENWRASRRNAIPSGWRLHPIG